MTVNPADDCPEDDENENAAQQLVAVLGVFLLLAACGALSFSGVNMLLCSCICYNTLDFLLYIEPLIVFKVELRIYATYLLQPVL